MIALDLSSISTHTPLAGRVFIKADALELLKIFLLTRPSRGASYILSKICSGIPNFYSHAPRGARLFGGDEDPEYENFYSHAPRGARRWPLIENRYYMPFLLTRPSRGASISGRNDRKTTGNFYSHAPRGARRHVGPRREDDRNFYSHAPRGARPSVIPACLRTAAISTHTPLAGRVIPNTNKIVDLGNFYSHAPRGARRGNGFSYDG